MIEVLKRVFCWFVRPRRLCGRVFLRQIGECGYELVSFTVRSQWN